ncbi:PAP2 superfamily protein [compost metagenome]
MPRHRLLFLVLAIWFSMTRVMVSAHYPSDIIAGTVYGAWFSVITAIVFSRYRIVFRIGPDGTPLPRQPLLMPARTPVATS